MRVISVTEHRSMPGRFRVSFRDPGDIRVMVSDVDSAADAASLAVQHGINAQDKYVIVACGKVLPLIPADLLRRV